MIHQDFHGDDLFFIVFLLCSLYIPFMNFSCTFCPATVVSVTVCSVVLGAPFSSEMSKKNIFFLMSSFYQLFVLVVLFVCLQWHTVGAEIKVPYVENPELRNFLPLKLKPGVGQSRAMQVSPTARKVSIILSDNICLPSPFTMFSKIVALTFSKNVEKSQGSDG